MSRTTPPPVRTRNAGAAAPERLTRVSRHLRLAWPVFAVFLAQRLLTVAFVEHGRGLPGLVLRWDAGWYLRLAQGGYVYPNLSADGRLRASNLAYFPLYPWLVRRVHELDLVSLPQALLLVSWLGGLLAVWAIFAVGHALDGRGAGIALAALWGMAPASLALTMGYPEGLFTAAAAGALLCLIRRRPVWAGACAAVAGLLRPSAVAVVLMVGAYLLVELTRWLGERHTEREVGSAGAGTVADGRSAFPAHALLGSLLSVAGLGSFMAYVGMRTGRVFGYFTVQSQWGQETAGLADYLRRMEEGLFGGARPATLVPVTIAVCLGYLLLFCLVVLDRRLVWASVYAAVLLAMTLSHITFQHVYARQLLPAFVLLVPLVRMRVPRAGAVLALTVGSILMSWGSAQFLLDPGAAL